MFLSFVEFNKLLVFPISAAIISASIKFRSRILVADGCYVLF